MPIEVEIGDTGQIVEFPDGTPNDVIQGALKQFVSSSSATMQVDEGNVNVQTSAAIKPTTSGFPGAGVIEPAATLVSGAVAEPVAGVAGILSSIAPVGGAGSAFGEAFAEPSEIGPAGAEVGAQAVEATREALTVQPSTEAGKAGLKTLGGVLQPVGEALQAAETFLGDETFEATGSPTLAAAAATLPTALIEALGLASTFIKVPLKVKQLSKNRAVKKAVVDAAPDIDQIKEVSRGVYKELDESGVRVKAPAFNKLVKDVETNLKREKFKPRLAKGTTEVLDTLKDEIDNVQSLSDIDALRQGAQGSIGGLATPNDKRLVGVITDTIDEFLAEAKPQHFTKGAIKPSEIVPKYKIAQSLWGRARRSELINEAFGNASLAASGFENGLVVEFRRILKNKKINRYFKPEELASMRTVVQGTTSTNIAKTIGRLGFSEGHATNIIGGAIGAGVGGKLLGAPGAIGVPVIGQVSRKLAQKLQAKNARFADTVIRAGDDAGKIAEAYLSQVPKAQRTAAELSELLLRPDIAIEKLGISKNPILKEAAEIAQGTRALQAAGVLAPNIIREK